jgi:hypothetical protein
VGGRAKVQAAREHVPVGLIPIGVPKLELTRTRNREPIHTRMVVMVETVRAI